MAAVFSAASLMAAAALPMALAAVMAAVSAVIVVIAGSLRILNQGAGQQGIHRPVRVSADSGVQADARLLKGFSGAAADTAADQDISPDFSQHSRQSSVALSVGALYGRIHNLSVLRFINLKLFRVSKMLKNFSIFIGNRNFHLSILPF